MKHLFKRSDNASNHGAATSSAKVTKYFKAALAIAAVFAPVVVSASTLIAHRGIFHDANDQWNLPENSFWAVQRAYDFGLAGVELDLRLSKDGQVMVTHDQIANRTTRDDFAGGNYNPIDGANGWAPGAHWINQETADHWQHTKLKIYGSHGNLVNNTFSNTTMQTLDGMLGQINSERDDILKSNKFMIILDIQDPNVLSKAAQIVQKWGNYGARNSVYLKFFASKGIFNDYRYNGATTCYDYARFHNMSGLKIIPQINDGELFSFSENDDAGIAAFQTWMSVSTYLQCWADAEQQHWGNGAAHMPIVSASVPAGKEWATKGAWEAINWARHNGRKTMSIVPNPDASHGSGRSCKYYTWQSTDPRAGGFNFSARQAKQNFVNAVNPDYTIIDIMGNIPQWSSSLSSFEHNMCR